MEIIEEEHLLNHVQTISPYFLNRLNELRDLPIVGDVRGMGLMACVELKSTLEGGETLKFDKNLSGLVDMHCQNLGLLVRPLISSLVMSPPLTISHSQIDFMVDTLRKGIILACKDLGI